MLPTIPFDKLPIKELPERILEKGVVETHPLYKLFLQAAAEVQASKEEGNIEVTLTVVLKLQLTIAAYEN